MSWVVPGTALPWGLLPETFSPRIFIVRTGACSDEAAIASVLHRADAAYIVHACNTLPALQAHADALATALDAMLTGERLCGERARQALTTYRERGV